MPQLKRPLNDGPDRPPKRKKLFGQSKFNPSRNLGAFGPKTLFAVLSDAGRGGSAAMQTFAEYVYRGSKAVVGVVWAQPPVLEVHDLEVAVQGAMDDAVADSLLQLWAKIKSHSMWGKAKVKLTSHSGYPFPGQAAPITFSRGRRPWQLLDPVARDCHSIIWLY